MLTPMRFSKISLIAFTAVLCTNVEPVQPVATPTTLEAQIEQLKKQSTELKESIMTQTKLPTTINIENLKKNVCEVIIQFAEETKPLFDDLLGITSGMELKAKQESIQKKMEEKDFFSNFESRLTNLKTEADKNLNDIQVVVVSTLARKEEIPLKKLLMDSSAFKKSHSFIEKLAEKGSDAKKEFEENINLFIEDLLALDQSKLTSLQSEGSKKDFEYLIGAGILAIISFGLVVLIVRQSENQSKSTN